MARPKSVRDQSHATPKKQEVMIAQLSRRPTKRCSWQASEGVLAALAYFIRLQLNVGRWTAHRHRRMAIDVAYVQLYR